MTKSDCCYGLDMAIHHRPLGFSYGNDVTGPMPERIIEYLGACGRFLHYKMGEKAGRRRIFTILSKAKELPQRELQDILGICSGSLSEIGSP